MPENEEARERARTYLARVTECLQTTEQHLGLSLTSSIELEKDVASALVKMAEHGRRRMMPGSFLIGKIVGIEVSIHVSWLLIVVLLTWSLTTGWFPALSPGWTLSPTGSSACWQPCCCSPRCLPIRVAYRSKTSPCSSSGASPTSSRSQRVLAGGFNR